MPDTGMPNGVWYSIALSAGSQALNILTAPGPKRGTFEQININRADESTVWPYIAGTVKCVPNLLWYGDFNSKKIRNDVGIDDILIAAGMSALSAGLVAEAALPDVAGVSPPGKFAKVSEAAVLGGLAGGFTVGLSAIRTSSYKYYCGFAYGICHGPIDAVETVYVDDRVVGSGTNNAGGSLIIDDQKAWGGEHELGGIYALCDIVRGDYWPLQQPNSYLASVIPSGVPAFSGKALFIMKGPTAYKDSGYFAASATANPTVRPVALRVKRLPNNLGVSAYKAINTHEANPAEVIYEWLVSRSFGGRIPSNHIDLASFQAAAQTFHTEGLGFSAEINTQQSVEDVLDHLTSFTSSAIYGSFNTGTIKIKLIRNDYSIPSLPVYRHGPDGSDPRLYNVIEMEELSPGTYAETPNEIRVEYADINANFTRRPVIAQDLANQRLQNRVVPRTLDMIGLGNASTAALVATRELRASSFPRPPITLTVNRDAYSLEIGSVIKFVSVPLGITQKILRVVQIGYGDIENNRIQLVCVEDMFGVGAAAYGAPGSSHWISPTGTAAAITTYVVEEAPYFYTRSSSAQLQYFAAKPNGSQVNFDAYTSEDAGASYTERNADLDFAPTATISVAMDRLTAATVTSVVVTPENAFAATILSNASTSEIANGENLIKIDNERLAFETVTDNGNGTYTLGNVWRAVLDTVPAPHSAGARVWFYSYGYGVSPNTYAEAATPRVKLLSNTLSATYALASASAISYTTIGRSNNPLPPGNVRINTGYLTTTIGVVDDLTVDWSHRNRLTQPGVIKQDSTVVSAAEDTTTYTVRWYATEGGGNVLLRTETGISGTTATMTVAEEQASGNYLGHLSASYRVEIDTVRGADTSTYPYIREVNRTVAAGAGGYNLPMLTVSSAGEIPVGGGGTFNIP